MTKLLELSMRFKIILMLFLLFVLGGLAFYLGQSSASPSDDVSLSKVQQEDHISKKEAGNKTDKSAEEAADKANAKTEADLEKMAKQLDEHKKEIEEDQSNGTVENGTVKLAPPKFSAPKDLKTRQADFKD